jgi:hypothetical protein
MGAIAKTPGISKVVGLPNQREAILLKAALLQPPFANEAWQTWIRNVDLEHDLTPGERRLLPLAYSNLNSGAGADRLRFHPKIFGFCKRTLYYNSILMRRLLTVVTMLETIGVQPIVLKGAALILSGTYRKAATRVMADYDLLVPFDRKGDVVDFLVSNGFQPLPRWNWYVEPFRQVHSISLESKDYGELDLHWFPITAHKNKKSNALFFAHKQQLSKADQDIFIPEPELQLVHAMVHGLQNDTADRTQWICDAVKLIRHHPSINWDQVAQHTQALHVGAFVQHGTEYLAQAFGDTMAEDWLAPIRRIPVSATENRIFTALNSPQTRMRDQLFLRKQDLQQHQPGRSAVYYWRQLYRDWSHAASASSNNSLLREFLIAGSHLLRNENYQMGDYRKK